MATSLDPESVSQDCTRVFKDCLVDLMEGIQDPDMLAVELYAKDVISRTTRDQVTQITLTREQKNTQLLAAVESQLHVSPSSFEVFLCALRKRPTLDAVCRRMEEAFRKYSADGPPSSQTPSETVSTSQGQCLSPNPASEPEPSGNEVSSPVANPTSRVFPYLNVGTMNERQKFVLHCKLFKDTNNIMSKFSDLIHYTILSLKANPEVTVKILSARVASLSAYNLVLAHKPLLRDQLEEIGKCTIIDEVFFILLKYCMYSFFNYGIIKKIITWFPTPDDERRLKEYTEDFKEFCKRRTFECPPDVFGHICEGKSTLVVKTEDNLDPQEETQGKVLDWVLQLQNSLAKILEVETETLYICRIDKGCVELLFTVPSFIEEDIFPLSVEQERALASIGVAKLTCGSYTFPSKPKGDSSLAKLEMLLSVLSDVLSQKDQTDAAKILLALSQSPKICSVMRQSACMNILIKIMHNIEHKGDKNHREAHRKAQVAMKNIIESTGDTRQGKYELCVLGVLERLRSHCDVLFVFIYSHPSSRRVDSSELDSLQSACDSLLKPVRKLYKYSNKKEHYRPAILSLGGLQATAELLIVNHRLITAQKGASRSSELVSHSSKVITVIILILVNLTYGDVNNKTTLCQFSEFLKSLMFHLRQQNEGIISSGAQVLRNLSWRATADIEESLLKCDASLTLMGAVYHAKDETTIQDLTSALWNLSAHSAENRHKMCSVPFGIEQLIELLSYYSPSGTTTVIENTGGVLKNLSVAIMQEEEFRRKFREAGGPAKLVQHLKSKNQTILSNATGILWNISARSLEDQKLLWDLGCVPLLDLLQTARNRNVAVCARGALWNLLTFSYQQNKCSSKSLHSGCSQPLPRRRIHSSNPSLTHTAKSKGLL